MNWSHKELIVPVSQLCSLIKSAPTTLTRGRTLLSKWFQFWRPVTAIKSCKHLDEKCSAPWKLDLTPIWLGMDKRKPPKSSNIKLRVNLLSPYKPVRLYYKFPQSMTIIRVIISKTLPTILHSRRLLLNNTCLVETSILISSKGDIKYFKAKLNCQSSAIPAVGCSEVHIRGKLCQRYSLC